MNMNVTRLSPDLLDILSDTTHYPDLERTAARFEQARRTQARLRPGLAESEINFQDSLTLKYKLDELEAYGSDGKHILPTLVNCEYTLYKLNAGTSLRQNPFLSHWVEVCQRWSSRLNKLHETDKDCTLAADAYVWRNIHHSRLVVVKAILTGSLHNVLAHPADLADVATLSGHASPSRLWWDPDPLDLSPFIAALEDEGIYERATAQPAEPNSSPPDTSDPLPRPSLTTPDPHVSPSSIVASGSKPHNVLAADIPTALRNNPAQAVQALASQPIDLPSLEALNALLSSGALEDAGIDPADVVRQYVQHGLRSLESPRAAHTAAGAEASGDGGGGSRAPGGAESRAGGARALTPPAAADREGTARAVRLLVLFVRSLVRKGLVAPERLYYEIQEICVRYVWVREVREFRAFIEEGAE